MALTVDYLTDFNCIQPFNFGDHVNS